MSRLALLLLLLLPLGPVQAEDEAPEAPPAATYATPEEVAQRLAALTGRGATVEEYGRSAGGRPLLALKLGSATPRVFVHGGLGARDAAGTAAALALAERLASDASLARRVSWLIVPAPNPDALAAFFEGTPALGGPAVDRDRDGRRGEDGPSDIDGDGEVRTMRRRSPRGAWAGMGEAPEEALADTYARVLVEAGVDASRDVSYDVWAEGLDDDGDGEVNEDPPGVDLTRQLQGWWEDRAPLTEDAPFAGFAPEARALMDLTFGAKDLVAWVGFSGTGHRILRASEQGEAAEKDEDLYEALAPRLHEATGLELGKASEVLGEEDNPGSDLDWACAHLGLPAVRVPVWFIAKEAGAGHERERSDEVDWLLFADRELAGDAFLPWTPFDHPTLGEVEIGGWKRFTRHEPPPALLGAAVERVLGAPLVFDDFAPRVGLELEIERRAPNLAQVTVRVLNTGGGATDTLGARDRGQATRPRVTLEPASGVRVVGGPPLGRTDPLDAGAASEPIVWLLQSDKGLGLWGTVTVRHPKAGALTEKVHVR